MTIEMEPRLYWKLCARIDKDLRDAKTALESCKERDAEREDDLYQDDIRNTKEEVEFLTAVLNRLEGEENG